MQILEMHQLLSSLSQITFLLICCCEGTSITLLPLGMVSVCPGGQVLLTCESISGSFLHWTVSVPQLALRRESILANQGDILSPEFKIGYTEFNITRTSQSPLTSQILINNISTEINGSAIYCSEDGNENNALIVLINVIHKDDALRSADFLNVSLVNHFLTNDHVAVTLQWPQEDGVVYRVDVLPETLHTDLTKTMSHNTITINLTISYNTQYNVTIVSSLCGVTHVTTKVLNYVNCGVPLVNRNVKVNNYSSTLDGSVLILTCENEMSNINTTDELILSVTCFSNGNWIPNPAEFICPSLTTAQPGTSLLTPVVPSGINVITTLSSITITVCAVSSIVFLLIGYACGWFGHKHKQSRTISDPAKTNACSEQSHDQLPQTPGPLYEELQPSTSAPECQDLVELKENVAYGPIAI